MPEKASPMISRLLVGIMCALISLTVGTPVSSYQFFEADDGGCRWAAIGPGNVDFLVDGSSTAAIGTSLLAEVTTARDMWNNITTAKDVLGNFTQAGTDYTDANFGTAWGKGFGTGALSAADGQFEVVLDETGDVLTNVFGLDPADINGFGPSKRVVAGGVCTITDAFNLLNGTRDNFDRQSTTVHEFGHIQGLAHSSVGEFNSRNNSAIPGQYGSPSAALDVINISNVPTMHPFSSGTGTNRQTPEQDDIASLSELYPEATFTTTLGGIQGTVTKCSDMSPLEGVNVRAVSTTDSTLQVTRYSAFDSNGVGRYVINGLPPGDYKVIVEPMGFNGFTASRMAIQTGLARGFPTEYYGPTTDEESMCSEEIPDTALPVTVTAGMTTVDIDIKVGGVDLAFIVDDTGSMSSEIDAVIDILNATVDVLELLAEAFPTTAIVTFKDNVTLRTVSDDPDKLRDVIASLFASGGGDCPESSMAAVMEAGRILRKGGTAILFTDADSRADGPSRASVQSYYNSRSLTFSTLLSATCDDAFASSATVTSAAAPSPHTLQGGGGVVSRNEFGVISRDEYAEPETLGDEDATTTFSSLATETGGTFSAMPRPFSGTDDATAYVNTGTNLSISSVVPAVSLVEPGRGPQGATLTVEITGANTNWGAGSTVSFAGGITVNSFNVASPGSITANLTIPDAATSGFFDVDVSTDLGGGTIETATGTGAFQIETDPGFATIVSVTPSSAGQDSTLDLTINGLHTTFSNTSTVNFRKDFADDMGITVNSVTAASPTSLTANITIATDAEVGFRDVEVQTDLEFVQAQDAFLVTTPAPDLPQIVDVSPRLGLQGGNGLDVVLTGVNTNFVNGTSVASFSGTGITVVSTTVTSATEATARINIDADASLGFRDVQVATGDETAVLLNAFEVLVPRLARVSPDEGAQGVSSLDVLITGEGTAFVNGTSVASFSGSGITVTDTRVVSDTQVVARVDVASDAALGVRDVQVTTGSETATLSSGFEVTSDTLNNRLVASILPTSRSVQVGDIATAFVSIINSDPSVTAKEVGIILQSEISGSFSFQTTNPATNALSGSSNTRVDIPAGTVQTFLIAISPTAAMDPTSLTFSFQGANTSQAGQIAGVNSLLFSSSMNPIPDIVALAATLNNDGIVNIPGDTGTGVFSVATVNVGAGGSITASAAPSDNSLPVNVTLCETDPATGGCISAIGSSVTTTINANATPTFGIFVEGTGNVPFDPATNRINVRFEDASGAPRGATSVAIRTQ